MTNDSLTPFGSGCEIEKALSAALDACLVRSGCGLAWHPERGEPRPGETLWYADKVIAAGQVASRLHGDQGCLLLLDEPSGFPRESPPAVRLILRQALWEGGWQSVDLIRRPYQGVLLDDRGRLSAGFTLDMAAGLLRERLASRRIVFCRAGPARTAGSGGKA